MQNLTLITGGVRSGKSRLAETLANSMGTQVHYLATMPRIRGDREQDKRIELHRRRRPQAWLTVECPNSLVEAIEQLPNHEQACVLIDCLSLYVSNILLALPGNRDPYTCEDNVMSGVNAVLQAMSNKEKLQFLVVTNEVGWGIVPETPLGRAFRDFLGIANQRFAEEAAVVWLTCAGLPLRLKPDLLALQQAYPNLASLSTIAP